MGAASRNQAEANANANVNTNTNANANGHEHGHQYQHGECTTRTRTHMHLVWVCRKATDFSIINDLLSFLEQCQRNGNGNGNGSTRPSKISLYATRESSDISSETSPRKLTADVVVGGGVSVGVDETGNGHHDHEQRLSQCGLHYECGRPDLRSLLESHLQEVETNDSTAGSTNGTTSNAAKKVALFACGPEGLVNDASHICHDLGLQFYQETFAF